MTGSYKESTPIYSEQKQKLLRSRERPWILGSIQAVDIMQVAFTGTLQEEQQAINLK